MEHLPQSPESRVLTFDEVEAAKNLFADVLATNHPDMYLSLGVTRVEESYGVAIRVEHEEELEFARLAAEQYIPNVPIDVKLTGPVEFTSHFVGWVDESKLGELIPRPDKSRRQNQ
jgi:hypothetical protein